MLYHFVWDEEKNIQNIKDHKLSFEFTARVFADVNRFEDYDFSRSDESSEDRYYSIGFIQSVPIYVSYVYVDDGDLAPNVTVVAVIG